MTVLTVLFEQHEYYFLIQEAGLIYLWLLNNNNNYLSVTRKKLMYTHVHFEGQIGFKKKLRV